MKLLISLAILSLIGNHSSYNGIEYRKLEWGDYTGKPYGDEKILAMTAYNIRLDEVSWDGKTCFTVVPEFVAEKSFTRTNDSKVLSHEQAHYNLAVIYSRLIESALMPYQNCLPIKQSKAEHIYEKYCERLRKIEDLFDKETANATNPITEAAWEKAISKELKSKL